MLTSNRTCFYWYKPRYLQSHQEISVKRGTITADNIPDGTAKYIQLVCVATCAIQAGWCWLFNHILVIYNMIFYCIWTAYTYKDNNQDPIKISGEIYLDFNLPFAELYQFILLYFSWAYSWVVFRINPLTSYVIYNTALGDVCISSYQTCVMFSQTFLHTVVSCGEPSTLQSISSQLTMSYTKLPHLNIKSF